MTRPLGLVDLIYVILQESVSIMAEDQLTGQMVGLLTNCIFVRGNVPPPKTYGDYAWSLPSIYAYLCVLSDILWHPNDVFKQYQDFQRIFYVHSLSVLPSYRRQNIGQTLVKVGLQLATEQNCQCANAMATSPNSRRIFENLGFRTLRMIDANNFVDNYKNGRCPIFPGVDTSVHMKIFPM